MTERPKRAAFLLPLWLLFLVVTAAAAYYVATDYERHREPTAAEVRERERLERIEEMRRLDARVKAAEAFERMTGGR
jgi:hypothetical protein